MIINDVRLDWVHLEEPRAAAEGAEPKFSVVMIIPKISSQVVEIKAAMQAAIAAKWNGKPPKGLRSPLRDGDAVDDAGERVKSAEYTDCYFISAGNKKPVEVLAGKDRSRATSEHMRSGNYASIKVGFYAYGPIAGNVGVGCGLNGVWITRRGEPLGAASEPWAETEAEDFSAVVAKAQAAGQQDGDVF